MHEALSIPLTALPFLFTTCAAVVIPLFWWSRPFAYVDHAAIRFSVALGAWALVSVGWLSAPLAAGAEAWYRFLVPLTFLFVTALVEAWGQLLRARLPRQYWLLYILGLALFVGAFFWHPELVRAVGGFWLIVVGPARWAVPLMEVLGTAGGLALTLFARYQSRVARVALVLTVVIAGIIEVDNALISVGKPFPLAPVWLIGLAMLASLSLAFRQSWEQLPDGASEAMSPEDGIRYGVRMLRAQSLGVLLVGVEAFRDWPRVWGEEAAMQVSTELGHELRQICRRQDRVVRWDGGGFIMIFPGIPFHQEHTVRDRTARALGALIVRVDDASVALLDVVGFGWAWGAQGASFIQVVEQAGRALNEARWRARRSPRPGVAE
ncbi:MAG: diguanylate cyclase [Thermaerobacter sp.]|nr:diguanylate cyclase [Thermaerobacter sp.]